MVGSGRVKKGAVLAVVALALALGGCGRRGRLEPAPDPNNPFALGTPKPVEDAGNPADKGKAGVHRRPKNPPIEPPNEPFVLDPLL